MTERLHEAPVDDDPARDRKPPAELVRDVARVLEAAMGSRDPDLPAFDRSGLSGQALLDAQMDRLGAVAGLEAVHASEEAAVWRFGDGGSTAILIHEPHAGRSDHTEVIVIRPLAEGEFGPGESTHVKLRYGVFHDPSEGNDGEAFVDNGSQFGKLDRRGRFRWVFPGAEALGPDAPEEAWASNLHDAQPSREGGDWGATVAELNATRDLVGELSGTGQPS